MKSSTRIGRGLGSRMTSSTLLLFLLQKQNTITNVCDLCSYFPLNTSSLRCFKYFDSRFLLLLKIRVTQHPLIQSNSQKVAKLRTIWNLGILMQLKFCKLGHEDTSCIQKLSLPSLIHSVTIFITHSST